MAHDATTKIVLQLGSHAFDSSQGAHLIQVLVDDPTSIILPRESDISQREPPSFSTLLDPSGHDLHGRLPTATLLPDS
jgi:hypothetical protein